MPEPPDDGPIPPPGYWMHETTGVLRPAVEAYLFNERLTRDQVLALRAYFRQWINHPGWKGSMIDVLRTQLDAIQTGEDVRRWLDRADEAGCDPL